MTPQEFIAKWQASKLSERAACHEHFLDLCKLLGQPTPAESDPEGAWYTFERGVNKLEGGQGWADVWMRGCFGWEYKGKHRDLAAAYKQLLQYREDLDNPPLLVVCDMDRFEVHTNFTGTAKKVFAFDLAGLADPANLDILRKVFTDPAALRPGQTTAAVTREAAEIIGQVADAMRVRGIDAHRAAHFLMKIMFSMFAEDIDLLKNKVFKQVLQASAKPGAVNATRRLSETLGTLFKAMATGGMFGADEILHFNGGLFADAEVIDLRIDEIQKLAGVNTKDWSNVEPSVFGTLFERILDPDKRSQIGAHYTSREDILTLIEPVVMQPLRREWAEVQAKCEKLVPKIQEAARKRKKTALSKAKPPKPLRDFNELLEDFHERLAQVRILDPACGSGNFLYVALNLLLDLEKEVITYGSRYLSGMFPKVRPTQLAGIEINEYAQELASVVIWIGYLQWMHHNGFNPPSNPVLEPIDTIELTDAIVDLSDPEHPKEPKWPKADFIVGNPPFLGGNRIRRELGDGYVDVLFRLYDDRVPGFGDLCCYWVEKARVQLLTKRVRRVGLLATQGIRGGLNRKVLDAVKQTGDIFFAESDRNWYLEGANVHVSMIGFDLGEESEKTLNGVRVNSIAANLTAGTDVTQAARLTESSELYHEGTKKGASFELGEEAFTKMAHDSNPHGKPNSDILRPYINGTNLYKGVSPSWIVYFLSGTTVEEAAQYQAPFEYVREHVFPEYGSSRSRWWLHERPRPTLIKLLKESPRYIATVRHSKHRIFVWMDSIVLPDSAMGAFVTNEDSFFGTVHSRLHEVWSLALGTQVRDRESGFRYTPTSCLETFPFPAPTGGQRAAIAGAAAELDRLRNNWLNPSEWTRTEIVEFPGSVDGPWSRYVHEPNKKGIGTVRYPRTVAKDEGCDEELKKRTLTNLYNQRPTWLDNAHRKLDEAVFAAYGWDPGMSDDEILAKLLELNLQRAGVAEPKPKSAPKKKKPAKKK